MARYSIELPSASLFTFLYRVKKADINFANHLAATSVLPIAVHAQAALLDALGIDPEDSELGLIMASSQVDYISESQLDDMLEVDISVEHVDFKSFDIYYRLRNENTDHEVARVKTRVLFFDYVLRKVSEPPKEFTLGLKHLAAQAA